jgi:hypothetical protein
MGKYLYSEDREEKIKPRKVAPKKKVHKSDHKHVYNIISETEFEYSNTKKIVAYKCSICGREGKTEIVRRES